MGTPRASRKESAAPQSCAAQANCRCAATTSPNPTRHAAITHFSPNSPEIARLSSYSLIALGNKECLRQLRECMSDAPLVLYLPEERQALFVQGARPGVLTLAVGQQAQGEE